VAGRLPSIDVKRVALSHRARLSYFQTYTLDFNFNIVASKLLFYYFCNTMGETFILSHRNALHNSDDVFALSVFRSVIYQ